MVAPDTVNKQGTQHTLGDRHDACLETLTPFDVGVTQQGEGSEGWPVGPFLSPDGDASVITGAHYGSLLNGVQSLQRAVSPRDPRRAEAVCPYINLECAVPFSPLPEEEKAQDVSSYVLLSRDRPLRRVRPLGTVPVTTANPP